MSLENKVKKLIKKYVVLPDVHIDDKKISKPYQLVKTFIKKYKPDTTILLGDFADISSLSAWDMDKRKLMEGRRFKKEIDNVQTELDYLKNNSGDIVYLLGNHEDRIKRYVDKNPEMEGMIELENVLDLENVKLVKFNDLYKIGHCYFTHGLFTNKYHASKHLQTLGCNIVYGHGHSAQTDMLIMKMQKPHMAYGLGCLCDKNPDYLKGRPNNWINQFATLEVDTKTGYFSLLPINIVDNKFIHNGKLYE